MKNFPCRRRLRSERQPRFRRQRKDENIDDHEINENEEAVVDSNASEIIEETSGVAHVRKTVRYLVEEGIWEHTYLPTTPITQAISTPSTMANTFS